MNRNGIPVAILLASLAATAPLAASETFDLPAPDGTPLATDVYLPPLGSGPWPSILQRTPYGKNDLDDVCLVWTLLNYACVAQDVRGRGDSGGQDSVFREDGGDGRATVEWIAAQPWSNGKVGTFGASALGIVQYQMAPGAPDALLCQIPIVASPDHYGHLAYPGGALREELVYNWLLEQDSLDMWELARQHRTYDDWWRETAVLDRVSEIRTRALHFGGWFDVFSQGTLDAYSRIQHLGGPGARGGQRLVMGPWTHLDYGKDRAGEQDFPGADSYADLLRFFTGFMDDCLKDEGDDGLAPARIYLMGAEGEDGRGNRWLDLPDWPLVTTPVALALGADGSLRRGAGVPGARGFVSDPSAPVPTIGGPNLFENLLADGEKIGAGPRDQARIESRADVLAFGTAPLEVPVTAIGRLRATIWARLEPPAAGSAPARDFDLAVRITDVYPDGRSMLIADGIRRARSRCGEVRECLVDPGVPVALDVDLWSTAYVWNPGHRIRIDVSGSNAPRFEVNRQSGRDPNLPPEQDPPVRATITLLSGPNHPSRIVLPLPPDRNCEFLGRVCEGEGALRPKER